MVQPEEVILISLIITRSEPMLIRSQVSRKYTNRHFASERILSARIGPVFETGEKETEERRGGDQAVRGFPPNAVVDRSSSNSIIVCAILSFSLNPFIRGSPSFFLLIRGTPFPPKLYSSVFLLE